jgi:hypothetical protein
MRNSIFCLLAILLGLSPSGFTQAAISQSTTNDDRHIDSPRIVAEFARFGQTATIPLTTLFTPKEDGLYRLSAYFVIESNVNANALWAFQFIWTDHGGSANRVVTLVANQNAPPPSSFQQTVTAFNARAGAPVSYVVTPSNPPPQDATYDLYFTVEKLESKTNPN